MPRTAWKKAVDLVPGDRVRYWGTVTANEPAEYPGKRAISLLGHPFPNYRRDDDEVVVLLD